MKILMTTVAIAAMAFVPATAHAQLIGGLDNGTLLGGTVGAGLGGVIGSNLAGSGQRQEGTALGAVLGGAAGYALSNRGTSHSGHYGPQGGYVAGPVYAGYNDGGYTQGGYEFSGGPGFVGGPSYGAPGFGAPSFPTAPMMQGSHFVPSRHYISGPIMPVTHFVQPAPRPMILSQPRTVFTAPVSHGFTYAAPNVRLAGPPIRPTVVRHTYSVQHAPIIRAERVMAQPANCPAATTLQDDGTCLQRTVSYAAPSQRHSTPSYSAPTYSAPVISRPYIAPQMADCPTGTTKQSDGTCLEASYTAPTYSSSTLAGGYNSSAQMAECPSGSIQQSDGICLSSSVTPYAPSNSSSSSVTTTYRAPKINKSHKKMHHKLHKASRSQGEYCYAGGTKRYDSLGNLIKKGNHDHCRHT